MCRAELEREQEAIIENATRGLGLLGSWKGETNWYGGRIQQIARLEKTSNGYKLQLSAMQKVGRSHRLARYLGSRRVLQIKIPEQSTHSQATMRSLREFLAHKFVLLGRVFAAFSVKDDKIYLVETEEDYERSPRDSEGDQYRCSLRALVDWYNPLELNAGQVSNMHSVSDLYMLNPPRSRI